MAIAKINAINASDIAKINGASAGGVAKFNSIEMPAGGGGESDYWVVAMENGNVAWANKTSLSGNANWTEYDNTDGSGTPDAYDIRYGKNASGNGIFVIARDSSSRELQVSGEDVSQTHDWTAIDLDPSGDQYIIRWAASSSAGDAQGVWMAGGQSSANLWRSIDGAESFTNITPPSMTAENIVGLSSDGNGKWAFGNDNKLYVSTDDGANWTSSTPWSSGGTPGYHRGIVYTNNSWVVIYSRSNVIYARSCAASDLTDWGTEFRPTITYNNSTSDGSGTPNRTKYPRNPTSTHQKATCEGVSGLVCMAMTNDKAVFTFSVNGKTITSTNNGGKWFPSDGTYTGVAGWNNSNTAEDITTDGEGNWILSCRNGDAYRSTDNGASWTIIVDGFSGDNWAAIAAPATFPQ